jgi:precorrin-6B methylase 2
MAIANSVSSTESTVNAMSNAIPQKAPGALGFAKSTEPQLCLTNPKAQRPAITAGFVMPKFVGKYWVWPEEYALLSKYVDLTQGSYLEIGSMCGIIAMSLAEKYPNRHFTCVDAFLAGHGTIAGEKQTFLRNLTEHNLKNVELIEGDSQEVVPHLAGPFDVAFIDGNHSFDYVLRDALNCWSILAQDGFIIFHDYGCVDETTRAVNEFIRETGAQAVEKVSSILVVCKSFASPQQSTPNPLEDEIQRLEGLLDISESQRTTLAEQINRLEHRLRSVENSAGWRVLNSWRQIRNKLMPHGSHSRKCYDGILRFLRREN